VFKKAIKANEWARIALFGPSGSGKSYTALALATSLAQGGKVAAIDTERGSLRLYADIFEFDMVELNYFDPQHYIDAIVTAAEEGYSALVIDSLSHAWNNEGGILDIVTKEEARIGNSFRAWGTKGTPMQNLLIGEILKAPLHIIVTMRAKHDYLVESDGKKTRIKKVGLSPVQRDDVEYEFTIVGRMDMDNTMHIVKSRCSVVADKSFEKPGADFAEIILEWLRVGDQQAPAKWTYDPDRIAGARKYIQKLNLDEEAINEKLGHAWTDTPLDVSDFIALLNEMSNATVS